MAGMEDLAVVIRGSDSSLPHHHMQLSLIFIPGIIVF
jgi:hypothetical protein